MGNYTEEELVAYEEHVAQFYQSWIDLYGRQGMNNYIHMIVIGNVLVYMKSIKSELVLSAGVGSAQRTNKTIFLLPHKQG